MSVSLGRPVGKLQNKFRDRLKKVLPGGVSSPVRAFKGLGIEPMVADFGDEDLLFDQDGKPFVDYCCSWGALILGHTPPEIVKKVKIRLEKGSSFGVSTGIEAKLAEKIVEYSPCAEKVRFVNSGTEATMTAARLARGYTGRDLIVKFSGNYHGHADFFLTEAGSGVADLNATSSSKGVLDSVVQSTVNLPYNDLRAAEKFLNNPKFSSRIAAVIIEPLAGNMGCVPAEADFIRLLREETEKVGALLIFDEVITGFRVHLRGAQHVYRVQADLVCYGKVMGGGFPAAAIAGKAKIMDCLAPEGEVYQAGTLSGNPVAMEAGYQTLKILERSGFYESLEKRAQILIKPIAQYLAKHDKNACIQHYGSMFTIFFGTKQVRSFEDAKQVDRERFARFFRFLYERGIYLSPSPMETCFVSSAHTEEHLKKTRDAILDFFDNE